MTDRRGTAAVLMAVGLTVVACADTGYGPPVGGPGDRPPDFPMHSGPTVPTPGGPGRTVEVPPPPPPVAWAGAGKHLLVVTWGSSSCPTGPVDVTVVGEQEIRLEIGYLFPGRDPCTADMAPHATEVELPDPVSPDEHVTVHLGHARADGETVVLPPAGG